MKPYPKTLSELRRDCPLLQSIEVAGASSKDEELIGKNHLGEIVVRAKGKITPAKVQQFRNAYQYAVTAGIIKPKPQEETI